MKINEKIKRLRELHQLSQEQMAAKLNLSASGYAKIEQGERGLDFPKLEKIAIALGMELTELLEFNDKSIICLINENSQLNQNGNNIRTVAVASAEIENLQLKIRHYEEMLAQKEREISLLNQLLEALKQ